MNRSPLVFALLLLTCSSSCHLGRFVTRGPANITDHRIFPYTRVDRGEGVFEFEQSTSTVLTDLKLKNRLTGTRMSLDDYVAYTRTTAFLVIREDSILFENYYRGYEQSDISNIFSVSKSITSLLVGIAIDDGLIKSVDDPVTAYLPDLAEKDPQFELLTIGHLLDMRAGTEFDESSYINPFANIARLYYGRDQMKQLANLDFDYTPGRHHQYQSSSTALLGAIVEEATGKELGEYLEEKVWIPMGMEYDATWSVDDKKHRSTKAYCCLNTTARDLAKIGRLYLNGGNWNGRQIVSADWVAKSTTGDPDNDCYQNQWYSPGGIGGTYESELLYSDSLSAHRGAEENGYGQFYVDEKEDGMGQWHIHFCSDEFYALGINGQFVYVDPDSSTIFVRLGEKADRPYVEVFRLLVEAMEKEGEERSED